jgi:hypothetical protein
MRSRLLAALLVGALILTSCSQDEATREVTEGEELFAVTFDQPGTWEEGRYPADAATPASVLSIVEGRYQVDVQAGQNASFTWGAGGDPVEDVIIEVETEQLSASKDNLYGVACRLTADDQGEQSGYVLLISGDGHYGIARLRNRTLTFLLEWHQSDKIKQGEAINTIRAVCVENYLALYANGTFLGEAKDRSYVRAGEVGLVAGAEAEQAIRVTFDDLTVSEGALN